MFLFLSCSIWAVLRAVLHQQAPTGLCLLCFMISQHTRNVGVSCCALHPQGTHLPPARGVSWAPQKVSSWKESHRIVLLIHQPSGKEVLQKPSSLPLTGSRKKVVAFFPISLVICEIRFRARFRGSSQWGNKDWFVGGVQCFTILLSVFFPPSFSFLKKKKKDQSLSLCFSFCWRTKNLRFLFNLLLFSVTSCMSFFGVNSCECHF